MLSYIEVSKSRVISNYLKFRRHIPSKTKIMCVLKGNGYGRGLKELVKILDTHVEYFAVDDIEELRRVRKYSSKPIFAMGFIKDADLSEVIKSNADLSVHSKERLKEIIKITKNLNKKPRLHVEIDAQFGRMGIRIEELPEFIEYAKRMRDYVNIYAVYAHLSCATDRKDNTHDQVQFEIFNKSLELFKNAGFNEIKGHIASTSAILVYNTSNSDFVRLGAGLFGMWTSDDVKEASPIKDLKSIMRWVTHVAQVKEFPPAYPIGYGKTYITSKVMKVAILPQGYGDGYDTKLSNRGEVLIRGKRCKVLGRVSMNMISVDASSIKDIKVGDEAVLLGWQGNDEITVYEIGSLIGTIHAEVITRINADLPRKIII